MSRIGKNYDEIVREIEFGTLADQIDESHYDLRDDSEKGRICFPQNKLYGRDDELDKLHSWYSSLQANSDSSIYVFLGGYSGTGKSALVFEFIRQTASKRDDKPKQPCNISAKFGELKSGRPFSALSLAMEEYVLGLAVRSSKQDLEPLRASLADVDISPGSEYATLLSNILMPGLKYLLQEELCDSLSLEKLQTERRDLDDSFTPSTVGHGWNVESDMNFGYDMNVIKYAFQNFIKTLAAYCKQIIIFIDDLQWADQASFQLLTGLLDDKTLKQVLFIGAFRVNEVNQCHQLTVLMKDLEAEYGVERVKKFDISNLSPDAISDFIADSIYREVEDVTLISDVVYTKTLGNIFYVKQALEELVRKNALYFDVICYKWQFGGATRLQLENFLSHDVVEMVLLKLRTLPKLLQTALALAAFTNGTFQLDLLEELLSAKSVVLEPGCLQQMMDLAYKEGLVIHADSPPLNGAELRRSYKFAHDRIREALCASVPAGDERDQFLLCIANVLLGQASQEKDDWMLFAAASHLNSLPVCLTNLIQLAELDLTVGKIASSKGAFCDATVFLRAGVDCLDPASCWKEHYFLSLELKNCLMDAEQSLGNYDKVLEITGEICQKAKSLLDKSRAHIRHLEASTQKNNRDYGQSAITALDLLALHGIRVPKSPTFIQVGLETFWLKMSKRNLSWQCLSQLPLACNLETIAWMKLATMALTYMNLGKQQENQSLYRLHRLAFMLEERILRIALTKQLITKDMALILGMVGSNLRNRGQYNEAVEIANAGISLLERFPEERGIEFLKAKLVLYSLGCLRKNFRCAVHILWQLHKQLYAKGEGLFSLGAAAMGFFGYLNASLPLDAFLEAKVLSFEAAATATGQHAFAVEFGVLRQCLYNLQGGPAASSNPVEVAGAVSDEEKVQLQFQGVEQRFLNRDINLVRLMLAVIFGSEAVMQQMLDQLDEFPISDIMLERQHFRLAYTGFAALILSGKFEKYKKWAKISMIFFGKLARFGSANGRPIYACMKALRKRSVSSFNEAIQECTNEGMNSLAALMNEWCGVMLLKQCNSIGQGLGENYLKRALWLYKEWGASGKVRQLRVQHEYLQSAMDEHEARSSSSIWLNNGQIAPFCKNTSATYAEIPSRRTSAFVVLKECQAKLSNIFSSGTGCQIKSKIDVNQDFAVETGLKCSNDFNLT